MTERRNLLTLGVFFAVTAGLSACSRDKSKADGKESSLPTIQFSADSPDLRLTWMDDRGDTHVAKTPDAVPEAQRRLVRVELADAHDTTSEVYVSDLSESSSQYTAHGMSRSAWEDEIDRRRKNATDLAGNDGPERPHAPPRERRPRSDPGPAAPGGPGRVPSPGGENDPPGKLDPSLSGVTAIVYGASWCTACHEALEHLKAKGVKTLFKNIETDKGASQEMIAKLDKAGGRRGAIPVIDVGGQIIVGYSSREIDRALQKAIGGTIM